MHQPLHERVIIKPDEKETKSAGGIILPDNAQQKSTAGTVVAVGPGRMNDSGVRLPMSVVPGQKVIYGKYSGTDVKIDGEDYVIVRDDDIYTIDPS